MVMLTLFDRGPGPSPALRSHGRLMVAVLTGTFLLCHPTQRQYLVELLPYLALTCAAPAAALQARARARLPEARFGALLLLTILTIAVAGSHRAMGRLVYDHHNHHQWGLASLLDYQHWLSDNRRPDRALTLTWWPGYLLVPGIRPYPGTEIGQPAERIGKKLSVDAYSRAGLRHPKKVRSDIRRGVPDWIVLGMDAPKDAVKLVETEYRLAVRFKDIQVYQRQP
jgi:hypothetical protein